MKKSVKRHAVTQPLDTSYRLIPLTQGQNAIVDDTDFVWLSQWNWCAHWSPETNSFYAMRGESNRAIYMHRFILNCHSKTWGDHKNHDTLDNRRENLRNASPTQNHANRRIYSTSTSGFKGVSWNKNARKWMAYIKIEKRRKYLGLFTSANEAARAYDAEAKDLFGEFAHLNFITSNVLPQA